MIHEIFGIKNNVVDLSAYGVAKEIEKVAWLPDGYSQIFRIVLGVNPISVNFLMALNY